MERDEIDALRRQAEKAYAQWRACDSEWRRHQSSDQDCTSLKAELDLAVKALFAARRPSLSIRPDLGTAD
jgi:hypothetical protein